MLYHVIIALNSTGKRKVGEIISILEKKGLELVEFRKRITRPKVVKFPNAKLLVIQHWLSKLDAMKYYSQNFSDAILQRRLNDLYGNHVGLFFESEKIAFEPDELWESIRKEAFGNGRKLPIMFVVKTGEENGIIIPFIPEDFDFEPSCRIKLRTLRPSQE